MTKLLIAATVLLAGCLPSAHEPPASHGPREGTISRVGACQIIGCAYRDREEGGTADGDCGFEGFDCPWSYPQESCDPVLVEECFRAVMAVNSCGGLDRVGIYETACHRSTCW